MPKKIVQEREAAVAAVVKLHNDRAEEVDWLLRKEARSWFEENFELEAEDEGKTLYTILSEVDRDWLEQQFERDPRFNPEHSYIKSSCEDFVVAMEEKIKAWLSTQGITERQYELFSEQETFRDVIVPFAEYYAYEDLGKVEHWELHTDNSDFESL
jgi:hypothetical protein